MNKTLALSERLKSVAHYIPKGATLADIGSDHAYLPCYAYIKGIISMGIAGEVNVGPYQSAKETVKRLDLEHAIDVRKGDGLDVLKNNEVDALSIAGMGGSLIRTILNNGQNKISNQPVLVLQPNNNEPAVREWLEVNHYRIHSESIVFEDGHIYELIKAVAADQTIHLSAKERLFGPEQMKNRGQAFEAKWQSEHRKVSRVLESLSQAKQTVETKEKQAAFRMKLNMIEEVLDE